METPLTPAEKLAQRNNEIFKNLKESKPRALGLTIQAFEVSNYFVTPNSNKFLSASGWVKVYQINESGVADTTKNPNQYTAEWDADGKCIKPVFSGPNGTTKSFPDADLVKSIEP